MNSDIVAPRSSIESLSNELINNIGFFLETKDKAALSQVSRQHYSVLRYSLIKEKTAILVNHVLRGNEDAALSLINESPNILLCEGTGSDTGGRSYKQVTAFQAALLCHDRWLWKKMLSFFETTHTKDEIARQLQAIFPNGLPDQSAYDFGSLVEYMDKHTLVDIQKSEVLEIFKKSFKDSSLNEIYYNPQHLLKALKIYEEKLSTPKWPKDKLRLFWCQVIGFVQRFLPACYAQAFCTGLMFVSCDTPPTRSFDGKVTNLFSSQLGSENGIYCGMDGNDPGKAVDIVIGNWAVHYLRDHFNKIVRKTQRETRELMNLLQIEESVGNWPKHS